MLFASSYLSAQIKGPAIWLLNPAYLTGWVGRQEACSETIFACMIIEIGARALGIVKRNDRRPGYYRLGYPARGGMQPLKIPDIDLVEKQFCI
jgi:hypothetical protein